VRGSPKNLGEGGGSSENLWKGGCSAGECSPKLEEL
jgi:hypothetical protein